MKSVIVTGAFGALGRAVVSELAEKGYAVAAVDKANTPADFAATLSLGNIDLTDDQTVSEVYARIAKELGPIAGLVNVAGGFVWEPVGSGSVASWDQMYAINLKTAIISTRSALPHLADMAAIVNVGAAAANQPGMGMAPYAASKAGVRALTESLADELKASGTRVNAVLPTIIDTPTNRTDMPDADTASWVRPEAAAKVIAFLLSEESAAITGACIPLSLAA